MASLPEHLIPLLETVRAQTEARALSHPEKLAETLSALETFTAGLPEEFSEPTRLMRFCKKGLSALKDGATPAPLVVTDALVAAFAATEAYLLAAPDRKERVRTAGQALDLALNMPDDINAAEMDDEEIMNKDLPESLNEAAALLLQIEPGENDDLKQLIRHLTTIEENVEATEEFVEKVVEARDCLDALLDPEHPADPRSFETVIADAGILLQDALSMLDGDDTSAEPSEQADDTDYMPEDADMELILAFIAESSDLITNAEEALLQLESEPEDEEAVSTVFRAFHNIKGTSAFFELTLVTDLAHHAETLLSRIRDHQLRYAGQIPDLALKSVDMLKDLFRLIRESVDGGPLMKPDGYDRLVETLSAPEKAGVTDEEAAPVRSPESLPEAPAAPEVAEEAEAPADEEAYRPPPAQVAEKPPEPREAPKKPASAPARRQSMDASIRVPIERLDRFIDMVGELVVSHSMVAQDQLVVSGQNHELQKKVTHTSKIVRELQNMSMSMRMIPLKTTFRKMARLVRDLSRKINKDVSFITEGEETEIDRNMVDIINDPLVHMVRNALDHGIETPDEREAAGKPRHGAIQLSAYHSAGNVVVEIRDDGKGLRRDAIVAKAVERGLIGEGDNLSDPEVYQLIFEPGFSTAQKVSDVSGRGVGMDVVKRNIEAIRGHVEISSREGKGTLFKMSLPLTLAIIDGMVVRVANEKYVIPTISIVRSVQPDAGEISTVLRRGEMLKLQGELIPLFRIAELFELEGAETDLTRAIVVVVENDVHKAGLVVDELIGSQQIVIKTLGESLGDIAGISGSAIMPNGRVGLILDVGGLVKLANT